ncbi:MAG: excinuclease ABC subunit A [Bifidobacterium sp. 56_9_plus]|nr:MAG: excinuclease ABC subunit A [Bifidobacterium sp. 56_9_plus]
MEQSSGAFPPSRIEVRGACVHNLKNVDVDIPLNKLVGIAGISGSGKSSLALGVLYAEGSRRYLEALSTYTRRRLTQASRAQVVDIRHVPAALALHQRPSVPGVRSTFGTMTELLNSLRLLFSRCASHVCEHCGVRNRPTMNVAAELPIRCASCNQLMHPPSAEQLSFNSAGACPTCSGTGIVRTVDRASLVPDETKSIDAGAVLPWGSLMWDLMKQVCGAMGVRTNIPFNQLTDAERDIVFNGPAVKKHILYKPKKGNDFAELDFTYFNAVYTVENALAKAKDEKGIKRVSRFLSEKPCPDCSGTRLSQQARQPQILGIDLAQATAMTLDETIRWVRSVPKSLPQEMRAMATAICESFEDTAERLVELGLCYLSLDRAGATLSTGERQRVQLARSVRNRTTGVLYVLDEPSIGLHPANVDGLLGVMRDLVADGNSVVVVDHDTRVLAAMDHLVEMGPTAGAEGGHVIAQGAVADVMTAPGSQIAPFLRDGGKIHERARPQIDLDAMFAKGRIHLETNTVHTVHPLLVDIPRGRLTVVSGVSGSGKTTMVLETLVPALRSAADGTVFPSSIRLIDADGISKVELIDATPIGANIRSTVKKNLKPGAFSYNTGKLRCSTCDGTGTISLDVQFLPDVDVTCPDCHGTRYAQTADDIRLVCADSVARSLPELMLLSVDEMMPLLDFLRPVRSKLATLHELGLGYLTLGEPTPALSGGEAQRLKLASEMGRGQSGSVFVFDEPTIGLHPLDVLVLLRVFDSLVASGATVVVIEHDLDVIANADYLIDMGPGGGMAGGRIVCEGTPETVRACPDSVTGRYLRG